MVEGTADVIDNLVDSVSGIPGAAGILSSGNVQGSIQLLRRGGNSL